MNKREWGEAIDLLYHPKTAALLKSELATINAGAEAATDAERSETLKASMNDKELHSELSAARMFRVNNDVLAHTFALSFLELSTLGDAEWPIVENDNIDKNFKVTYIGENNGVPKKRVVERRATTQFTMNKITTEEYQFPLWNIQTGRIDKMAECEARIRYELDLKIDQLALTALDAADLSSGLRATLNLHPSIVSANIPDANHLNLNGVESPGDITVEKMKQILDYYERFGEDVQLDGEMLRPKVIFISSTQKRQIWDFVDLVSGYDNTLPSRDPKNTIPTDARVEIYRSAKLEQMFGYKFSIVSRNTIPDGTAWISTNKPAGWFWQKPSMDLFLHDNSMEMQKKNLNSVQMQKVIQFGLPSEWTYRFNKITW